MAIFAETKEEIFPDILNNLIGGSNISERSPGGKARAFAESVSNKIENVWSKFDANMAHAFLDGAEGKYLDFFGDMFGISRSTETAASVNGYDEVIRFYRPSNTTGSSVLIPQGTTISSEPNGAGSSYVTTADATISALGTSVYVSARSVNAGVKGNTGRGTLIHHSGDASLSVINESGILTGSNLESDENFRFRISNQILSSESGNFTAIRLACLSVPGVADVNIFPFFRGVGTFEVLVKSTSPSVSDSLLSNIRRSLQYSISQGVSFNVRRPDETGISMELNVYLRKNVPGDLKLALKNSIKEVIYSYVNNLDIGEELIVTEIVQIVMQITNDIKTLGESLSGGGIKPIFKLRKHKTSNVLGGSTSEELLGDFSPAMDEKLLIELHNYPGNDPVIVNLIDP